MSWFLDRTARADQAPSLDSLPSNMCTLWPRAEQGEQHRKVSTALTGVQAAGRAENALTK